MFRLLGFMTGAALVIGAMVMVMGAPALRDDPTVAVANTKEQMPEPPAPETPVTAPTETLAEIIVTAERLPDVAVPAELVTEVAAPADPIFDAPPPPSVEPASPAAVLAEVETPMDTLSEAAEPAAPAHDSSWQSVWNPFRSQIAANGFAARLHAVTEIDYRVVRLKPGAYQVAFAYTDDSERAAKITQIQNATGLDLPEARQ